MTRAKTGATTERKPTRFEETVLDVVAATRHTVTVYGLSRFLFFRPNTRTFARIRRTLDRLVARGWVRQGQGQYQSEYRATAKGRRVWLGTEVERLVAARRWQPVTHCQQCGQKLTATEKMLGQICDRCVKGQRSLFDDRPEPADRDHDPEKD